MTYVAIFDDGTLMFFRSMPDKNAFGVALKGCFMASGHATVSQVTDWIANNYEHPL